MRSDALVADGEARRPSGTETMSLGAYLDLALPTVRGMLRTRRPRTRIAVLNTVWSHHARRSGYQPVVEGLGVAIDARGRLLPARMSRRMARKRGDERLEHSVQIATAMRLCRRDTLLVADGDFLFDAARGVKRIADVRVFAVFHQITPFLVEHFAEAAPESLDGAICVARCQMEHVRRLAPVGRTWFVPLGIDTQYFVPGGRRAERPTVLCVGVHCRDFATLQAAASRIRAAAPDVVVRLIAPRRYLLANLHWDDVEVTTDVDDEELRTAYQEAWALLLPLTDSTANTALLESMASGTPIVTTDVGGVPDYVDSSCAVLCPRGDAEAHAAATLDLLRDAKRRDAMGAAARAKSAEFAWPRVRETIRGILLGDPR